MPVLLLALVGCAIGSFLNVVTLRYQPERRLFSLRDVSGRSRCPACGHELRWHELVPILSFIAQLGRCRSCGARLSFQYPLVEVAGAAIAVGVPLLLASQYGVPWGALAALAAPWWYYALAALWIAASLLLLVVGLVDRKYSIIPNGASLALAALGAGITGVLALARLPASQSGAPLGVFQASSLGPYALLASFSENVIVNHIVGALAGAAVFWCLWRFSRGRAMGFGDVKLAAAVGAILGWPDIILAIAFSFVLGGVWGGALLAFRHRSMKDRIPFGPFLVAGTILTVAVGREFLAWYFGIFPA